MTSTDRAVAQFGADKELLFIPGAQKSGTSSLFWMLNGLDLFCGSEPKEPCFFGLEDKDRSGHADWYFSCFKRWQVGQCLVDASTAYLACTDTAPVLSQAFPHAKVIILLRDPVDRLWSSLLQMQKQVPQAELRSAPELVNSMPLGLTSVQQLIHDEDRLLRKAISAGHVDGAYMGPSYLRRRFGAPFDSHFRDPLWAFRYFKQSLYSQLVPPFVESFGSRLEVAIFEEFISGDRSVEKRLTSFLRIPPDRWPTLRHDHRTWMPRGEWARHCVQMIERSRRAMGFRTLRRLGSRPPFPLRPLLFQAKPEPPPEWCEKVRVLLDEEYRYWLSRYPRLKTVWRNS